MTQRLAVSMLVLLSGTCVNSAGPDRLRGPGVQRVAFPEALCSTAVTPPPAEYQQLVDATVTCVDDIDGLREIIEGLGQESRAEMRGYGNAKESRVGGGIPNVATVLEANGYLDMATTLRQCISGQMGMLQSDGTYNMGALKASILEKVAGLDIEANTLLGLDSCPDVEEFDVVEYLQCIMVYCVTGAAP